MARQSVFDICLYIPGDLKIVGIILAKFAKAFDTLLGREENPVREWKRPNSPGFVPNFLCYHLSWHRLSLKIAQHAAK